MKSPYGRNAARISVCVATAVVLLAACSSGDRDDGGGGNDTSAAIEKLAAKAKTKKQADFETKDWTDATTGGNAVAVPDGSSFLAALDKSKSSSWTISYDVDSVSDVDILTQIWKPPVMDSLLIGNGESGKEEMTRVVYDEKSKQVKTCGTGKDRNRCEVEAEDSIRPRLRVFRNLSPGPLRESIGATAERPGARFATRTISGHRAQCVTAPPAPGDGITQACVDDARGAVLYLDGLIENIVFDLLVVDDDFPPTNSAAQ